MELDIDIPDSRTVTLPPEVPVGRAKLTVTVDDPLAPLPGTGDEFRREMAAFEQMLPTLLTTHRGRFVAVFDGRVVAEGADKLAVARAAYRKLGPVPVVVRMVCEDQPVRHVSGPRLVGRAG